MQKNTTRAKAAAAAAALPDRSAARSPPQLKRLRKWLCTAIMWESTAVSSEALSSRRPGALDRSCENWKAVWAAGPTPTPLSGGKENYTITACNCNVLLFLPVRQRSTQPTRQRPRRSPFFFFLRIGDLPFLPAEFCGKKGVRNYGGREWMEHRSNLQNFKLIYGQRCRI